MAWRRLLAIAWVASTLFAPGLAWAQDLGHKFPGGIGIDAGVQNDPGFAIADRFGWYASSQIRDRNGNVLPVENPDLDIISNAFGIGLTLKVPLGTYVSAAFAFPLAHFSLSSDVPLTNVDRFGVGDFYLMPLKVGWRLGLFDVVSSYALYLPSGRFEAAGGKGVSGGQATHEFSLGGALFLDRERRWRASALASYDLYEKKHGIDITRGDNIQVQGGAGAQFYKVLDVGFAGYALWQVQDDQGADVSQIVRGSRDRVFGLGPEASLTLPVIRTKLTARYLWDIGAQSRPQGSVLFIGLDFKPWAPD
jgi:hypothetical protein